MERLLTSSTIFVGVRLLSKHIRQYCSLQKLGLMLQKKAGGELPSARYASTCQLGSFTLLVIVSSFGSLSLSP